MQSLRYNPRSTTTLAPSISACHGPRRAFTVVELVIVVMVMGILAAVAAPTFFDSLLFHRVETAARRVKADLDYARQRARLISAAQTVTFANSVYTLGGTAKSLDNANAAFTVDLKKSPYLLDSATATFGGSATITFDGYGTPSSGGSVVLTAKDHQCTVTVEATTGATRISSNHTGSRTAQAIGN
jgi:prepilin-type N-terminal cleavage/methylation domain-containing protein